MSQEAKAKISKSNMGRIVSQETRDKISKANGGENCSPETREKLSKLQKERLKNKPLTGENNPFYGKTHSLETKIKMSEKKTGSLHPYFGKPRPLETRIKISESHKGMTASPEARMKMSEYWMGRNCGEKSHSWKGGISFEPYCPKWTSDLRRRIRAFFDHQCVLCGKTTEENGRNLDCHHVEYNKQACCDGEPVQFAALCRSCHTKTGSDRSRWENMIHVILYEIYNNRSYYTKEEWKNICSHSQGETKSAIA